MLPTAQLGRGCACRFYSKAFSPDISTIRTVFRDLQVACNLLDCLLSTKCARRIRAIVSRPVSPSTCFIPKQTAQQPTLLGSILDADPRR